MPPFPGTLTIIFKEEGATLEEEGRAEEEAFVQVRLEAPGGGGMRPRGAPHFSGLAPLFVVCSHRVARTPSEVAKQVRDPHPCSFGGLKPWRKVVTGTAGSLQRDLSFELWAGSSIATLKSLNFSSVATQAHQATLVVSI